MNYLKDVMKLTKTMDLSKPKIHHIMVYHDDWCSSNNGGDCDCNPDVKEVSKADWMSHYGAVK